MWKKGEETERRRRGWRPTDERDMRVSEGREREKKMEWVNESGGSEIDFFLSLAWFRQLCTVFLFLVQGTHGFKGLGISKLH